MKKFIALLLTVVLTATVVISATVAYLQDEDSDVNVMTLGNVKIEQIEQERDENGKLKYEIFNRDVKASYIVSDLLSDLRKIEAEFDTKVGIPNANTDKRERLITDEVNSNNVETEILAAGWMDNIQRAIRDVNDMFDVNIKCEWRYPNADQRNDESARTLQL